MRVPLSWLAEYVELPTRATPESVQEALVKVGLEEEDIHRVELSGPIVVGQVLEFVDEPQKNGKVIRWCQVRVAPEGTVAADGGEAVHGIVCGAHNFEPGDKVVVTLPGSVLPGPFPIAARKTYGHVSDGMIASARELGIGDDHDGILTLKTLGLDPEIGTDALTLLGLDDTAIEINVTPDRGYAFSMRGVAREYAHSTGARFSDPAARDVPTSLTGVDVRVDDLAPIRGKVGCSVFVTRVVTGVDAEAPTPPWMAARLRLAGIRSLSILVDITNYVMLELGQPIHGYDRDALTGGIVVRRAHAGETLTTLDNVERALQNEDLLITDESGPIGLAGVMGGDSTEMNTSTSNVLIEAANFDPVSIARTARRHKLPSEASKRFERGVDPHVAAAAADRVVELMVKLAGGSASSEGSWIDTTVAATPISLPTGFAASLIGVNYTDAEERGALTEIGCTLENAENGLLVTPPTWRPDLTGKADLVEEIARIVGYDRIPSVLPVAPPGHGLTPAQAARRAVAGALASAGSTEVLAYPFVTADSNALFGSAIDEPTPAITLANAMDAGRAQLRTSLLPGLLEIAHRNLSRGLTDQSLSEIGVVFRPSPGVQYGSATLPSGTERPSEGALAALDDGIPPQPRYVAVLELGNAIAKQPGQQPVAVGVADVLARVAQIGLAVGVHIDVVQGAHKALHPGRTAELRIGDVPIGFAGELLPDIAAEHDLPRVVAVAELNLDAVLDAAPEVVPTHTILTQPAATQDLSLVVSSYVAAADVREAVRTGAGGLLEDIRLVDDYRGSGVDDEQKSLTFALRFRASDRTLTAAEASEAKLAGAERAGELFGATIRD
ncbi:phenylalanine--tRNA ligase subunit beta [Paramicrobacterium chengjingii]|uniref:Phenylalanine--tRNA ligase beta subunit n=1 Tax=Paramicrobacterium chengjingii TaxID=2769067 RepID=A0ABX6YEA4_9MICO|nr:phenylalanine--tRNA ligase subunit beta [Microbacterium chengjingii]QPZ37119.1 phenylalanine--tRNA ligase subunit beta [Microbacterium chengjingii]